LTLGRYAAGLCNLADDSAGLVIRGFYDVPMTRFVQQPDYEGAEFIDLSMASAVFREVDLSGARMRGVVLVSADIDGAINGLRVNGVEVMPLIEAELDRLHPERLRLRPTTPETMRDAVDVIEELWQATVRRAGALPEQAAYRSVNGEWSLAQTLRHTIFVVDAWYGHAAALRPSPFHPIGMPASFTTNGAEFGIDESAAPTLGEILAVRAERIADLRAYLAQVRQEELDRVRGPNTAIGCPPPAERTAVNCLQVIFSDQWAHMQFANRDLAILEQEHA
jgi:DinB superfamily